MVDKVVEAGDLAGEFACSGAVVVVGVGDDVVEDDRDVLHGVLTSLSRH